ncbi:MAG: winged helix DNA-binding domain-containing protein, partial [Actinobacteria bacterium]|nr:winged helix DNA-binding domain-containing protein [Actinomycetota bacterium]
FPGTVLLDGFVAGAWRISRERRAATVVIEPFEVISRRDRDAIAREAERLLAFAAPAASHDVTFARES